MDAGALTEVAYEVWVAVPEVLLELAADDAPLAVPAVVPVEEPLELVVWPGARLLVTPLARVWYSVSERVALAAVFSLITIDIPAWQCFPWEQ